MAIGICLPVLACGLLGEPLGSPDPIGADQPRDDGAYQIEIPSEGSLQNPAWAPDGQALLVTRFQNGYNREPADLLIVDLHSGEVRTLVSDGSGNVNLPGASWNGPTGQIAFSSTRDPHDEIYVIDAKSWPGEEVRITHRRDRMAYEPSLSPAGAWVVFESHELDIEGNGIITTYRLDGTAPYQMLTDPNGDCRQPNWSPAGDLIVYQSLAAGQWDIWVMSAEGMEHRQLTEGSGDKTDASFSPDGVWIIYSYQDPDEEGANLYIVPSSGGDPARVTEFDGYDGAASWSPDGNQIVFESCSGDPDGSAGTTIWMIDVPDR